MWPVSPRLMTSQCRWGWWFETLSRPLWCHCYTLYQIALNIIPTFTKENTSFRQIYQHNWSRFKGFCVVITKYFFLWESLWKRWHVWRITLGSTNYGRDLCEESGSSYEQTGLTLYGLDKMASIMQTKYSNVFSWMKMCIFWPKFHWNSFLRAQLTASQHWLRLWLGAQKATNHYLNQWRSSLLP